MSASLEFLQPEAGRTATIGTQIEGETLARSEPAKERQLSAPLEMSEYERVKLFLMIQIGFLFLTPFTGGFRFALWSMMDTALMIQAIGVTALAAVLPEQWQREWALWAAVLFYLCSLAAMGMAVMVSGVTHWGLAGDW